MPEFGWDGNTAPLAYLITIRTYGTWLHGDERSSVDLRGQNVYGTPRVKPVPKLDRLMERNLAQEPFIIEATHLGHIENAIKVCPHTPLRSCFCLDVGAHDQHERWIECSTPAF